jgi:hypothetical protein
LNEVKSGLRTGRRNARQLPQTFTAQAVAALRRHRQLCGLLGAPAIAGEVAGEFRSAAGAGEAARGWNFCPICHESNQIPPTIFMPGSS